MDREALKEFLSQSEGSMLVVYDDATGKPIVPGSVVKGHPTIGKGRCLDTQGISESEESFMFESDVARAVSWCRNTFKWFNDLSDNRQNAVCAMFFKMGPGGVLGFKNMLAAIDAGDYAKAADCILNSRFASQVGRAAVEIAELMRSG